VLGGFILGGSGGVRTTGSWQPAEQFSQATVQQDVDLPPELRRLMTGWKCPCPDCDDVDLVGCTCNGGAIDAKKYAKELFEEGLDPGEIRKKMARRFGQFVVGGSL
jgi:cytochrome c-type biogenesis protein CcmH/NrfF